MTLNHTKKGGCSPRWAFGAILLPFLLLAATPVEEAKARYDRTDYRGALQILLPLKSTDPAVLALTGRCYFMDGDFKRASEVLEAAVAAAPSQAAYHLWLGRAYGRRAETASVFTAPGLASKARQSFERSVALDPHNREALNDLFEYYLQAPGFLGGGIDKAEKLVQQIAQLDVAEKHYALARIAERRKEYQMAEAQLRRAAEIAPRQIGRLVDLARFLAQRGRQSESDAVFLQASKVSPNSPRFLFARAQTYIEQGRNLEKARALLQQYLRAELTPDDPSREEARKLLKLASGV